MLSWILCASGVEYLPHGTLNLHPVETLLHDVVLVEDLAEEVPVVEGVSDLGGETFREVLAPADTVSGQGDIERDDVLDIPPMDRPERVLAVLLCNIERFAMKIFSLDRKGLEM